MLKRKYKINGKQLYSWCENSCRGNYPTLKFNFKASCIGCASVPHFAIKIQVYSRNRNRISIGNRPNGIQMEIPVVYIDKQGILTVSIQAWLAMIQKIGISRFLNQVSDSHNAVLKLIIKLCPIVDAIEQGDQIGPAAKENAVLKTGFLGI